jgi:CPA1 family monovalent cation:H+ antiporter
MWNPLEYAALLFAITAGFAYANHYLLGLPRNSGLLVIALAASLCLRLIEYFFPEAQLATTVHRELDRANFGSALLNGFLAFMLFAGALHVDVKEMFGRKWTILALATVGVLLSTFAMAAGMFGIFRLLGTDVPLSWCLAFGALISPTDPVTVLGVLRQLRIPPALQAVIGGESLFNDGIGIVLFTVFMHNATSGGDPEATAIAMLLEFVRAAGGGVVLGLTAGGLAFVALRGIDEYNIELLISLTLVTGTYGLAQTLGVSGPVAVVVAGLLMGSVGVRYAVSGATHEYLQKFWALTDELLNSFLFLLIGLEFAVINLRWTYVAAALLAIPLSLAVRGLSIVMASLPLNVGAPRKLRAVGLLTWSGLRGGISVALALSLPSGPWRDALVTACYGVVIFTMIVQGLSLGRVAGWLYPSREPEKPGGAA